MTVRIALIAAAILSFAAASPAAAQWTMPDNPDVKDVAIGAVLGVCAPAMDGHGFDMNDTDALWRFGLAPDSAADEAELRQSNPGMESARHIFPNGGVVVGFLAGRYCATNVTGPDRFAARDAVIAQLAASGTDSDDYNQGGGTLKLFHFIHTSVGIRTPASGNSITIVVQPPE